MQVQSVRLFAMHALFKSIAALTAFAVCARAGIPGHTRVNGVTRLLGSSFGVPGLNLTFDYIVRKITSTSVAETITHRNLIYQLGRRCDRGRWFLRAR